MGNKNTYVDKVVVITGGSSGLGLALAELMLKAFAKVILIARDKEKLEQAKTLLEAEVPSAQISLISLDILDEEKVNRAMRAIADQFGCIDVLINSAGILEEGYFENLPLATFKSVMETNYMGTVICTKAVLPALKASRGQLVNIASMAAIFGAFGYTSYCASKFAVLGFSEALRYELKPQGVGLSVICPPEFEGPMVDGIAENRTLESKYLVQKAGVMNVRDVASETFNGMVNKQAIVIIGRSAKLLAIVNRWLPSLSRMMSHQLIARVYKGPRQA